MIDTIKGHRKLYGLQFVIVFGLLAFLPISMELMITSEFETHKVLSSLSFDNFTQTKLGFDILFYVFAIVFLHLIFSVIVWLQSCYLAWRWDWAEKRIMLIGIFISCLSVWWCFLLNAYMYPLSRHSPIAFPTPDSGSIFLMTLIISTCLLAGITALSLWTLVGNLYRTVRMAAGTEGVVKGIGRRAFLKEKMAWVSIGLALFLVLCLNAYSSWTQPHLSQSKLPQRPNIILFGIDSLRHDRVGMDRADTDSPLPNVNRFIGQSAYFETAYTPLARTFCAWTSILTGTYPTKHGARFNLVSKETLNPDIKNLAQIYQSVGYRTIYATDEKRFSNIDSSYGFKKIIGPSIGAADFILGSLNDFPLPNLISNTISGKILFPYTYANRAADLTYKPETFVDLINSDLPNPDNQPLFLAIHLCLPHIPYQWSSPYPNANGFEDEFIDVDKLYEYSLGAVDQQFQDIMNVFEQKGYLKNTIIVLLSDHGESFDSDNAVYVDKGKQTGVFRSKTYGHGTNVISREQHQVVLSFRGFGIDGFQPGVIHQAAGLIDIAPTLLHYFPVASADFEQFDGISLHPWLDNRSSDLLTRSFFVESGFSVPAIRSNSPDMLEAFGQGVEFYTVSKSGYATVKPTSIALLLSKKQYGMYTDSYTYAAIPDFREKDNVRELLVDQKTYGLISDEVQLGIQRDIFCAHFASEILVRQGNVCTQ